MKQLFGVVFRAVLTLAASEITRGELHRKFELGLGVGPAPQSGSGIRDPGSPESAVAHLPRFPECPVTPIPPAAGGKVSWTPHPVPGFQGDCRASI